MAKNRTPDATWSKSAMLVFFGLNAKNKFGIDFAKTRIDGYWCWKGILKD
jgi:hypothetical protein